MTSTSFNRLSFEGAVEAYLSDLQTRNYSKATIIAYRENLKRFDRFLKKKKLSEIHEIKLSHLLKFSEYLEKHKSKTGKPYCYSTRSKNLMTVRSLFRFLKKKGIILMDPSEGMPAIKSPQLIPQNALTIEESHAMMSQPRTHLPVEFRDLTIMQVLLSTGVRPKSLCSLTIYSLDFQDGFLRIDQAKFNKDYIVPLGSTALQLCRQYLERVRSKFSKHNPAEKALFLTRNGTPFSPQSLAVMIQKYAKKAKIQRSITPYSFRRFVGVEMIRSGKCSVLHVQQMLNHENLKYVHIYTKMMPTDLKKAHQSVPRERRLPKHDISFKGFDGQEAVFFKKRKS